MSLRNGVAYASTPFFLSCYELVISAKLVCNFAEIGQ